MKILELFCGLGGWSKGFHDIFPDAEFYGIDIKDFGYPYNFIKADLNDWEPDQEYDIVLASPPCTEFCQWKRKTGFWHYSERIGLDLVYRTFYLIEKIKPKFWVLENVWGLGDFLPPPREKIRYGFRKGKKEAWLWGNFPALGFFEFTNNFKVNWDNFNSTEAEKAQRGLIPRSLSYHLAKSIKENFNSSPQKTLDHFFNLNRQPLESKIC